MKLNSYGSWNFFFNHNNEYKAKSLVGGRLWAINTCPLLEDKVLGENTNTAMSLISLNAEAYFKFKSHLC